MCGRFTLTSPASLLADLFEIEPPAGLVPRYNIAPTQDVLVVRRPDPAGPREGAMLRWGLVPSWARDVAIGSRMINARSETAAEKPSFRAAMKKRRCLVPADGFYEWAARDEGPKQPYRITLADGEPFAFAGLWEHWHDVEEDALLETCTILTTSANDRLRELHDRMPVILPPPAWDEWLTRPPDEDARARLLGPYPGETMRWYAVSRAVNSARHDDPSLIDPLEEQPSLFDDPGG
jgi:putative SOS response-associated peptidase YedK